MSPPVLTLEQAEDLAARTLAAIGRLPRRWDTAGQVAGQVDADRERVTSDLAGLREHVTRHCWDDQPCDDASRYAAGLLRTASLYDVTP